MNMTVLAIILIIVGLFEIFGFTAALLLLRNKLKEFIQAGEEFSNNFLRNYALTRNDDTERYRNQINLLTDMAKQSDVLREQYEALDEAYDVMNDRYRNICEQYAKLLEACSAAEERYSDCYDQLKYQNERFDRIEKFFVEPYFMHADEPEETETYTDNRTLAEYIIDLNEQGYEISFETVPYEKHHIMIRMKKDNYCRSTILHNMHVTEDCVIEPDRMFMIDIRKMYYDIREKIKAVDLTFSSKGPDHE